MCLIKDVCCKNKHAKIKTKTGNIGRNKGENEKIQAKREKLKKMIFVSVRVNIQTF